MSPPKVPSELSSAPIWAWQVPGAEAVISEGEAIYLPANSIHLLENLELTANIGVGIPMEISFGGLDWTERIEERDASHEWRPGYMPSAAKRIFTSRRAFCFADLVNASSGHSNKFLLRFTWR